MLKDPKFVLETAMRAPVLVSLQLTNIFDNDLHKVSITTLVFFFARCYWETTFLQRVISLQILNENTVKRNETILMESKKYTKITIGSIPNRTDFPASIWTRFWFIPNNPPITKHCLSQSSLKINPFLLLIGHIF